MAETSVEKALSPAQRGAAALQAGGANTEEIARTLGVSTSTIKAWRKLPLYSVAIDELGRRAQEDLQPIVNQIRNELAQAVISAVGALAQNLNSGDEKISNEAASILMRHADLVLGKPGGRGDDEKKPQAAAQSVVKVSISPDLAKEGSPFHVEGSVEEETVEDAEVA